jgi:hypothetical protein
MGNLKQALRKVISTNSRVDVRFDIQAKVDGYVFPSDAYTTILMAESDEEALSQSNAWLLANLPDLVEANVTRAEVLLLGDPSDVIKTKRTVRIEELAAAYESSGASPDVDQDRILGLWQGPELNDDQKEFLANLYKDYYSLGEGAVDTNHLFDKQKSKTYDDIMKRLWDHPKTKDLAFVEKLSKDDKAAMEEILYPSSVKGYAVDFAYEIWEKYFMDSVPVELDDEELDEQGLAESKDEVDFLARAAVTDGCESEISKCARSWIEEETGKWLADKEADNTDD